MVQHPEKHQTRYQTYSFLTDFSSAAVVTAATSSWIALKATTINQSINQFSALKNIRNPKEILNTVFDPDFSHQAIAGFQNYAAHLLDLSI